MNKVLSDDERCEYDDRIIMLNKVIDDLNGRIAELEHKNQLLQITIAEALEECIGEDIVKATKILEQEDAESIPEEEP